MELAQPCLHLEYTVPKYITNLGSLGTLLQKLSPEIRLKIYRLVLPVNTFFSRRESSGKRSTLLSACKTINQEAYPLFLSLNNFDMGFAHHSYYPPNHEFYRYVQE
jgi:hypothetical protein